MNTMSTISKDDKAGKAGIADNRQNVQHNTYDAQAMNTQENSISDTQSDEVFRTEEKHLHDVYAKLVQEKKTLEAQMIKAHERAQCQAKFAKTLARMTKQWKPMLQLKRLTLL